MSKWCQYACFGVFFLLVALTIGCLYFEHHFVITFFRNRYNIFYNETYKMKSLFVSFGNDIYDGRRLGNQIFSLAAVIYVAELTARRPVIGDSKKTIVLEEVFMHNLVKVNNLCPCVTVGEIRHLAHDKAIDKLITNDPKFVNKTILVSGFRQSWKYTLAVERRLRGHLVLKEDIKAFADNFFQINIPTGWKNVGFVRVGVHVRRGDILKQYFLNYGYTVPNETYFHKAMKYFTTTYSRVQFITTSDDYNWTRTHISSNYSLDSVNVTHSFNHTAGQDFALLSMCDHVIMSSGTFGWWAAWLAKGTTIYYSDWPRKGSGLAHHFVKEDFFPPNWIPMDDS